MTVDPRPDEVRQLVLRVFAELGVRAKNSSDIDEKIRIDGGNYRARTFRHQGLMAMWLIALGVVQFYDRNGKMLRTVNLRTEAPSQWGYRERSAA